MDRLLRALVSEASDRVTWIGGFFIVGAAAHASLALIFDCRLQKHPVIAHLLYHRQPILVHLHWVCVFLGFHSFGLYVHNDTVAALGRSYDQFSDQGILLLPVFARFAQLGICLRLLTSLVTMLVFSSVAVPWDIHGAMLQALWRIAWHWKHVSWPVTLA